MSRERFCNEEKGAFDALNTALEVLMRIAAPLLPLISEEIWRGLTGERSVHLTDWLQWLDSVVDENLVAVMDEVRDVVSHAHSLRKANKCRSRLSPW